LRRQPEKCVAEKYAHWIGLYLSFLLSWVLGPFVHGRLQNLKTSKDTFGHDITPGNNVALPFSSPNIWVMHIIFENENPFKLRFLVALLNSLADFGAKIHFSRGKTNHSNVPGAIESSMLIRKVEPLGTMLMNETVEAGLTPIPIGSRRSP